METVQMTNDVKQSLTSAETRSTGLVDYVLSRENEIIDVFFQFKFIQDKLNRRFAHACIGEHILKKNCVVIHRHYIKYLFSFEQHEVTGSQPGALLSVIAVLKKKKKHRW